MSEIKVNKISPRSGTAFTLGDSGDTFTVPSGGTLTIACGATITNSGTQTGFGRTGTVDWQTSSIKTSTFTAASGEGYFANTSGGSFTINLPEVFLTILAILSSNIFFGRSCKSSIEIFIKFASIRSAIRSSAISKVIYKTFLP